MNVAGDMKGMIEKKKHMAERKRKGMRYAWIS
jgi:hypothetical protein